MKKGLSRLEPLPVVLKPVKEELLSSWLSRHAAFYGMTPIEFVRQLLQQPNVARMRSVDASLTNVAAERLAKFLRSSPLKIRQMTHCDLASKAHAFVSQLPIQTCDACQCSTGDQHRYEVGLRYSYWGWRITCPICSSKLSPLSVCDSVQQRGADLYLSVDAWENAREGERLLDRFLTADDETAAAAIAAFRMLLVPRAYHSTEIDRRHFKPRTVGAIVPWFDKLAKKPTVSGGWNNHLIAPLPLRLGILVGFHWLLENPRPRFHILRSVALGNYRLQLERLGTKATPILAQLWFS